MKNKIIVLGNPIAKKRPRFARIGKGVRTYSDQVSEEGLFILDFTTQIKELYGVDLSYRNTQPMKVNLCFYMKRPKSHYGTGKNSGVLKDSAPKIHTNKPDLDNLVKFVMDSLNKYLFEDDSQVYALYAYKLYCEKPRTEISWE